MELETKKEMFHILRSLRKRLKKTGYKKLNKVLKFVKDRDI